jgi:alpha-beta hydrolase superfamily lysophospholipase
VKLWSVFGAALAVALAATPASAGFLRSAPGEFVDLPTRPGVTLRYGAFVPDGAPQASVVLLVGGNGLAGFPARLDPDWGDSANFLIRIRENLRQRGLYVAIPDAPSDHGGGLGTFRVSADHAEDLAAIIADLRHRVPGEPVWLIGTSRGSTSAANGAARLGSRGPDGVVLTSTLTRVPFGSKVPVETALDVDLAAIRVPTLVIYHRADSCSFVAPADATRLLNKLAGAPKKDALFFDGGDPPRSIPCEPLSPHGYYGIEDQPATAIADWILAQKH